MKTLLAMFMLVSLLAACGKAGDNGATGPQGPAGSFIATKSVSCKTENAYSTFPFSYTYLQYSNGDVFVSCSIFNQSITVSQSSYYRAKEAQAALGTCVVGFDIDAASGGKWTFENTPTRRVVYSDNGANSAPYGFAAGECITE